jgi:hypothetical protein
MLIFFSFYSRPIAGSPPLFLPSICIPLKQAVLGIHDILWDPDPLTNGRIRIRIRFRVLLFRQGPSMATKNYFSFTQVFWFITLIEATLT